MNRLINSLNNLITALIGYFFLKVANRIMEQTLLDLKKEPVQKIRESIFYKLSNQLFRIGRYFNNLYRDEQRPECANE